MAEAARRSASLMGPTWIMAKNQNAARGRRGRMWTHPKGNFAATLGLRPAEAPDKVALRSFVTALALADALTALSGRPEAFALKWPNDVLLNGGKVAGILLESIGQAGQINHVAIGIGVNLVAAPSISEVEENAVRPVALTSLGAEVTQLECLEALASAYASWETRFTTYGFAPIREAWLSRATRLGEVITARTSADQYVGTFETVDMDGNLVLTTGTSRRAIPAAEIFF